MFLQNYFSKIYTYGIILLVLVGAIACTSNGNGKNNVVLKYGNESLTSAEIDAFIPNGISKQDSVEFAEEYIENWMRRQMISTAAREAISDIDESIRFRLKNYEHALLQQVYSEWLTRYPNMDTLISEQEILAYYKMYPNKFINQASRYQYFHLKSTLDKRFQNYTWLRSKEQSDFELLKEWCEENAVEYKLDSTYVSEMELLRVGRGWPYTDIRRSSPGIPVPYTFTENDTTYHHYFKMIKTLKPGEVLPFSLCKENIRTILLVNRKNEMINRKIRQLSLQAKTSRKFRDMRELEN